MLTLGSITCQLYPLLCVKHEAQVLEFAEVAQSATMSKNLNANHEVTRHLPTSLPRKIENPSFRRHCGPNSPGLLSRVLLQGHSYPKAQNGPKTPDNTLFRPKNLQNRALGLWLVYSPWALLYMWLLNLQTESKQSNLDTKPRRS